MFFHNYKYRLKCIVRDKAMMFWTLLFPIILAILFDLALGNIGSADNFKPINLAVVKNSSYEGEKEFTKVLDEVSDKKRDDVVFNTQYVSKNKAEKLLEDNKVEGYIFFDDDINIVVNKSGLNQTIIKSFVDEYKEKVSTIKRIIKENPKAINEDIMKNLLKDTNYLKEVAISKQSPDPSVN